MLPSDCLVDTTRMATFRCHGDVDPIGRVMCYGAQKVWIEVQH